jgi:hypothetical protein
MMRVLALGAVGLVVAAACSQQAKPKSSASVSPTVNPAAALAAWKACGSDVVPPANVLTTPKLPVKVDVSKTNGAVSQAEADKWARAYLREQDLEDWALTTNRVAVFSSGCLGSQEAYDNLFAEEVANINKAKAAGGHLEYDPLATVTAIAIVTSPVAAQSFVSSLSGQRPRYAIVATAQGPLNAYIVDPLGKRTLLGQTPAGKTFRQAYFGQYQDGPIGALWFQFAFGDCASVWMAGTCNV